MTETVQLLALRIAPDTVCVVLLLDHTGASQELHMRRAERYTWARLHNLWGALLGRARQRARRRAMGTVGAPRMPFAVGGGG